MFQLYIVKEYQRLKEIESNQYNIEWNVKRILSKANYHIHTDAINKYIIPKMSISQKKEWIYADEADMLNIIMFGCTAKQWREANPQRASNGENIRDMASINELAILSNLETLNSSLIKQGVERRQRAHILLEMAKEQKQILDRYDFVKSAKNSLIQHWLRQSRIHYHHLIVALRRLLTTILERKNRTLLMYYQKG